MLIRDVILSTCVFACLFEEEEEEEEAEEEEGLFKANAVN